MNYLDKRIVYKEVPNEICLAFSISNCQFRCEGCHSPQLRDNVGEKLSIMEIIKSISKTGCTCVLFLGTGNRDYKLLNNYAHIIKGFGYKTAIYMGEDELPEEVKKKYWDYIKLGHYDKNKGPITSETTNQRMFKVEHSKRGYTLEDITYKFWTK